MEDFLKLFVAWTKKKIRHHVRMSSKKVYYHKGQIWWVALGKNIGFEMDGKHDAFHRPVLILKKYNEHMCFVVPLTTQIKTQIVWYQISVPEGDRPRVANISQGRTISIKRLLRKERTIEMKDLNRVKQAFCKQFL